MSRLQLSETKEYNLKKFKFITDTIAKESKSFLKEMTRWRHMNIPYSGRSQVSPYFHAKVRKNRRPKDLNKELHNDLDKAFFDRFRIKARSETLFVTGSNSSAHDYGNPYMIFPVGNYRYVWSEQIEDLYGHINFNMPSGHSAGETSGNPLFDGILNRVKRKYTKESEIDKFHEYYDEMTQEGTEGGHWVYEDDDDGTIEVPEKIKDEKKAVDYIKRTLVDPDDFYIFSMYWVPRDYDEFYAEYYKKWREEISERMQAEAQMKYDTTIDDIISSYQNNALDKGLLSGNEIMLEMDKYFAVEEKWYEPVFRFIKHLKNNNLKYTETDQEEIFEMYGKYI